MKKLLLLTLSFLLIFQLGCKKKEEEELPVLPTYEAYHLYCYAVSSEDYEISIPEKRLQHLPKLTADGEVEDFYFETADIPSFDFSLNGINVHCQYYATTIELHNHGVVPIRIFFGDGGQQVYVNSETGLISCVQNTGLGVPESIEITWAECQEMVQSFIFSVFPDVDLASYSLETDLYQKLDPDDKMYGCSFYYEKRCNDMLTADFIHVNVSNGRIVYYRHGDDIDVSHVSELGIDKERIQQILDDYVEQVCSQDNRLRAKIGTPDLEKYRIGRLEDGTYAVYGTLSFSASDQDKAFKIGFVIPIGK